MTMADIRTAAGEAIERVREALGLPVGSDVASLVTAIEALKAERDRLRAEVKHLGARVREWEAVHADLAARCDSGDIPIRLGERYSLAVLREIDRLRTEAVALRSERDRLRAVYEPLRAQVTDWHTRLRAMWLPAAMGAVADLREEMGAALGQTPAGGDGGD